MILSLNSLSSRHTLLNYVILYFISYLEVIRYTAYHHAPCTIILFAHAIGLSDFLKIFNNV